MDFLPSTKTRLCSSCCVLQFKYIPKIVFGDVLMPLWTLNKALNVFCMFFALQYANVCCPFAAAPCKLYALLFSIVCCACTAAGSLGTLLGALLLLTALTLRPATVAHVQHWLSDAAIDLQPECRRRRRCSRLCHWGESGIHSSKERWPYLCTICLSLGVGKSNSSRWAWAGPTLGCHSVPSPLSTSMGGTCGGLLHQTLANNDSDGRGRAAGSCCRPLPPSTGVRRSQAGDGPDGMLGPDLVDLDRNTLTR